MPKKREDPKQWSGDAECPDAVCDVLEYWSRYFAAIARFRGFRRDYTIYEYTATLKPIANALKNHRICEMSAYDVWDAVTSVPGRINSKGEYVPYSNSTICKRLSVIHDIFLHAEACGICADPLWCPPWDLLGNSAPDFSATSAEIQHALTEKFRKKSLPRYFSTEQEQALAREILTHIHEDGRWLGMAILLWCGVRPSEMRRLYFSDFVPFFDRPDRRQIFFCRSADSAGQEKGSMKNKYGPRSIPEHIELAHIANLREAHVRSATGNTDISAYPAVSYGNDYARACSASELSIFVKSQLLKVMGKQDLIDITAGYYIEGDAAGGVDGDVPDDPADQAADKEVSARWYRRNFCTKNYAETELMDWQSRQTMGHKTDSPVTSPYGEGHLLEMLEKMDHRMILPEIHPGWHTVLHGDENKTITLKDAGVHYISVPGECLQNFEKICIDVDVHASGAGFLVEFLRKCPKDAIAIRKEYIPATGIHTGRVNADAVQWPVSWNVAGKDLAKQKEKEKKDE